eukprot:5345819-Pleurochrysis_carterae.AAC.1
MLCEADDIQHTTAPHCLGIMHRNCAHTIMYLRSLRAYANSIRWYLTKRIKVVFTFASFAAASASRAAVGACGRSNRQASLLHAYSHWTGMPSPHATFFGFQLCRQSAGRQMAALELGR